MNRELRRFIHHTLFDGPTFGFVLLAAVVGWYAWINADPKKE